MVADARLQTHPKPRRNNRGDATGRFLKRPAVIRTPGPSCESEGDASDRSRNLDVLNMTEPLANSAGLDAEQLRATARQSMAEILEVATKSGNLKGTYVRQLKVAAASLQDVVNALADRTEVDEVRRVRADNNRLRREVEVLRAELKAHRREFSEMRATMKGAPEQNPALVTSLGDGNALEELKRSIICSVGDMVNARIEGLEERLLPAANIRPSLAADRRRDLAPTASPTALTVPAGRQMPAAITSQSATTDPATMAAGPSSLSAANGSAAQEETWAAVVGRKKKGRKKKTTTVASAGGTNLAARKPVPPAKKATAKGARPTKAKLSPPSTAAVIIKLQPEAAQKGVTYKQVLEQAEEQVNLEELGISNIKFRESVTGARVLELPSSVGSEKADQLADKLREALDGVVSVIRPIKCVGIRITGLSDAATKDKVAHAVALAGGCPVDQVKSLEVQHGPRGSGSVIVRCPVAVAKTLSDAGKVMVGWCSASVRVLEQRALRCYKCLGIGHTRPKCPSGVSRDTLCFRCGEEGHMSADCTRAPRCAVCADAGKPSGHTMGGKNCNPPLKKRGEGAGAVVPANAGSLGEANVMSE